MSEFNFLLILLFFGAAFLHSSVGLAGGSSYTALMAIFGVPLPIIPSISLSLNTLVSSLGSFNFIRYKHFQWRILLPFLIGSIPAVYIGARVQLPAIVFYSVLLGTLLVGVYRLAVWREYSTNLKRHEKYRHAKYRDVVSIAIGAVIGFISGCVGIGGGIYLVPAIIVLGFADAQKAAACGVVFIWVNSIIGLLSKWQSSQLDIAFIFPILCVVGVGGFLGSWLGSTTYKNRQLEKALIVVMVIACLLLIRKIISLCMH